MTVLTQFRSQANTGHTVTVDKRCPTRHQACLIVCAPDYTVSDDAQQQDTLRPNTDVARLQRDLAPT